MITKFGKFTRKLRVDNTETLKDMASRLGIGQSYLSAVETGKRNIPNRLEGLIVEKYNLNEQQIKELRESLYFSTKTLKLTEFEPEDRVLILSIAKKLYESQLSNEDKKYIKDIINKKTIENK